MKPTIIPTPRKRKNVTGELNKQTFPRNILKLCSGHIKYGLEHGCQVCPVQEQASFPRSNRPNELVIITLPTPLRLVILRQNQLV
jgi:hypothetical protein